MIFIIKNFFLIIIAITFLNGCSYNFNSKESQIESLQKKIIELQMEIEEKEKEINKMKIEIKKLKSDKLFTGGMNFTQPEYKTRFVEKELDLLLLPYEGAISLRTIKPNTLVTVNDAAHIKNILWLYVTIPTYDSPSDNKGWIRELDTVPFKEDRILNVQSDVLIKEGTPYFEVSEYSDIANSKTKKLPYDTKGRLAEKKKNFVKIIAPGGWCFWVNEQYLIYPTLEENH